MHPRAGRGPAVGQTDPLELLLRRDERLGCGQEEGTEAEEAAGRWWWRRVELADSGRTNACEAEVIGLIGNRGRGPGNPLHGRWEKRPSAVKTKVCQRPAGGRWPEQGRSLREVVLAGA